MSGKAPYWNQNFLAVIQALQRGKFFSPPAGFKSDYWDFVKFCCSFDIKDRPLTSEVYRELKVSNSFLDSSQLIIVVQKLRAAVATLDTAVEGDELEGP